VACLTVFDGRPDDPRPAHRQITEGVQALIERTVQNHPAAFFAFREPQAFRPEMQTALRKLTRHFQTRLSTLLEQARQEGQFDFEDAGLAARAICSLPGYMVTWYRPDGRLTQAEVVRQLTRLALKMVTSSRTR
jgi:hypothetical protein